MPIPPIPPPEVFAHMADILTAQPPPPLVLLPVRLETRYLPQGTDHMDVCVRVYPDKIHIDSHEPELTSEELTWGRHLWKEMARAGDREGKKAAWRQLAERFGPPRAAWVATALNPSHPFGNTNNPKKQAWTRAPLARLLPDRWTMVGYKTGSVVFEVVGEPIPKELATGPNPLAPDATVPDDLLAIDEGMKWLVDFKAAEQVGMGLRATLRIGTASKGLDFLIVVGLRAMPDPPGVFPMADLFNVHRYTSGLSFVPPGTPSNNTPDAPSGFSSKDPGHDASYTAEFEPPELGEESNSKHLVYALGLPGDTKVFAKVPHAESQDQLDTEHMNAALWEATWGYFLTQMLGVGRPGENPLKDNHFDLLWGHFLTHVRTRVITPVPVAPFGYDSWR